MSATFCAFCGRRTKPTIPGFPPDSLDHSRCAAAAGHLPPEPPPRFRNDPHQRWLTVARLRHQGWTFQAIGDELNVSRERARAILKQPKPAPAVTPPTLNSADVWAVAKHPLVLDAIADA